jgi:hypothetical protein
MSIDELGRAAAAEARRATNGVNAMTMLEELQQRSRTRTIGTIGVVVAVCAAIVTSILLARSGKPSSAPAAGKTNGATSSTTSTSGPGCEANVPPVQCLSDRRVRVSAPVRATIHAPANFVWNARKSGRSCFESYRNDVNGTGVTVMENAVPVRDDSSWARDGSAGTTAASMAEWLSARPFLTHTSVKRVLVDGIAGGWRVSGELKSGAKLPADKSGTAVGPTFLDTACTAGFAPNLFGNYTLFDLPGAGVTVIWSWTIESDHAIIADNQTFIDGLRFG